MSDRACTKFKFCFDVVVAISVGVVTDAVMAKPPIELHFIYDVISCLMNVARLLSELSLKCKNT